MAVDVSKWCSAESNGGYEEFWPFREAKNDWRLRAKGATG